MIICPILLFNSKKILIMGDNFIKWLLFIALSLIWGSSFILMKVGMENLSPFQVASVRIVASGIVMLPMALKSFKTIPSKKILLVLLSGALGSLFPAYLFCLAETGIDSSLAGALNSLTPIFTIITSVLFFRMKTPWQKVLGILIAFSGCAGLFFSQAMISGGEHYGFIFFVLVATFCYGLNVNVVQHYLKEIPSLSIVAMAMTLCAIPALSVLFWTGFFFMPMTPGVLKSVGFSALLGAMGTSLANLLFYMLIKKSGPLFASMVTYGIPFVAILWGIGFHENIGWMQIVSLSVILGGVYVANSGAKAQ